MRDADLSVDKKPDGNVYPNVWSNLHADISENSDTDRLMFCLYVF